MDTPPTDLPRGIAPGDEPSLLQRFTLAGVLWKVVGTLKEVVAEQRESNRLQRLHIRALTQSPNILNGLDPHAPALKAYRDPQEFDGEIMQPTNAHYADLQDQFAAAKARGEDVDMGTDPSTLMDPERPR